MHASKPKARMPTYKQRKTAPSPTPPHTKEAARHPARFAPWEPERACHACAGLLLIGSGPRRLRRTYSARSLGTKAGCSLAHTQEPRPRVTGLHNVHVHNAICNGGANVAMDRQPLSRLPPCVAHKNTWWHVLVYCTLWHCDHTVS